MIVSVLCWCLVNITINYPCATSTIYLRSIKFVLNFMSIAVSTFKKQKVCLLKYVVEPWFEKQSTVMRHDRGRIDHHENPCLLECVLMRWKLVEATKIGLYVVNFLCHGKRWRFMEIVFVSIMNFRIGMLRYFSSKLKWSQNWFMVKSCWPGKKVIYHENYYSFSTENSNLLVTTKPGVTNDNWTILWRDVPNQYKNLHYEDHLNKMAKRSAVPYILVDWLTTDNCIVT